MENNFKKKSLIFRFLDKFQRRNRGNLFMNLKNYYYYINSKIFKFTKDNRAYIIRQLNKNSIIAEVGVWKGDFSFEIFKNTSPRKLVLVDPWIYNKNIRGCAPQVNGEEPLNQSFFDQAKMSTFKKFNGYKAVYEDLTFWYPKLKNNGKIFGDDFYWREEDNSFSVKEAYYDFISKHKIKKWCVFKSQICLIKNNV